MTIAYFECFGGISGDMVLGALLDAGAERSVLDACVEALGLAGEIDLAVAAEERGHLRGTRVEVRAHPGPRRTFPELLQAVETAGLPPRVRERSGAALTALARAESELHGRPVEQLHLHELGGADTLVDVAGAAWLLESLGVDEVYASPLPAPRGTLRDLPLPAPASLRVLAGTGAVIEPRDVDRELVTPTGAAILAATARFARPGLQLERVGYGFGSHPAADNALAVWVGQDAGAAGAVDVVETNLDDMTPADLAALASELMDAGALDVTLTPTVMKKGRPGHILRVICEPVASAALTQLVLRHSSSLGLRVTRSPRVIADRDVMLVDTPVGEIRVKVKRGAGVVDVAAEHDDLQRLARATGADPRRLRREAEEAARRRLEST